MFKNCEEKEVGLSSFTTEIVDQKKIRLCLENCFQAQLACRKFNMKNKKKQIVPANNSFAEFLLYKTPDGKVKTGIFLRDENIWLKQAKIAELFFII